MARAELLIENIKSFKKSFVSWLSPDIFPFPHPVARDHGGNVEVDVRMRCLFLFTCQTVIKNDNNKCVCTCVDVEGGE